MHVYFAVMDHVVVFVCTCIAMHASVDRLWNGVCHKNNQNNYTLVKIQETTSKFRKLEKFKGLELCFCVVCNYSYSVTKTINKYIYTTQQLKPVEKLVWFLKFEKSSEFLCCFLNFASDFGVLGTSTVCIIIQRKYH